MKAYFISMTRGEETQKGMNALKGILKKDGFVAIKSKIDVGVTHFEQKYYISPTKPGTFIVITELVFHLEIEAIQLQNNTRDLLMGCLDKVQKKRREDFIYRKGKKLKARAFELRGCKNAFGREAEDDRRNDEGEMERIRVRD